MGSPSTVLIVPGLRDHVAEHWQTLLAARLPCAQSVPPMGREALDCAARVAAIEQALSAIEGPVIIVAHSGGCLAVAHWAAQTRQAGRVRGALLAVPPDFDTPLPAGYPAIDALRAEIRAGERAVTTAMRVAGNGLKSDWRTQITRAKLGPRLANTIRSKAFPATGESLNAASLIWSNAPAIIGARSG